MNGYVYGPSEIQVEQANTEEGSTYLHHGQRGRTLLLTGSTDVATLLGYDGQYTNSDTGLVYLRARNYDPATWTVP